MNAQTNRAVSTTSVISFWLGLLLTAPGWVMGYLGVDDGIGPTGPPGVAEMAGFVFSGWAVFHSIRMLFRQFFDDPLARMGYLGAAVALAGGFYLLMTIIGSEASMNHKRAYTGALQPLGYFGLALLTIRVALWLWPRVKAAFKAV
jgi:hypothetical protein